MKFSDCVYKKLDFNVWESDFKLLLEEFNNSDSFYAQDKVFKKINDVRNEYTTNYVIAMLHFYGNTANNLLKEDLEYLDENHSRISKLYNEFFKILLGSKFRSEFENHYGNQLFVRAEFETRIYCDDIAEDEVAEKNLVNEYEILFAGAALTMAGNTYSLDQLTPFKESPDREVRKKAINCYWDFIEVNSDKLDDIFDKLVKLRHSIALKLGFKNYTEYSYVFFFRKDYDAAMISKFREDVKKYAVPLSLKLKEMKRIRLGLEMLSIYDANLEFPEGNPKFHSTPEEVLNLTAKMYSELSEVAGGFFNKLMSDGMIDPYMRKGKARGGFCTKLPAYDTPFLFDSLNGTSDDIRTITHETGHVIQGYMSMPMKIPEYTSATIEIAEIPSLTMELLTSGWMELFFKEDAGKYRFIHLSKSIDMILAVALGDEFQHYVYDNPGIAPAQRRKKWLSLNSEYFPDTNYEDIKIMKEGGSWLHLPHLFQSPFYFIDYALAQFCAYQLWQKFRVNRAAAMDDYFNLCRSGGSKSFNESLALANLKSPFEAGLVQSLTADIEKWLDENNP